jgi:hypothetical protein
LDRVETAEPAAAVIGAGGGGAAGATAGGVGADATRGVDLGAAEGSEDRGRARAGALRNNGFFRSHSACWASLWRFLARSITSVESAGLEGGSGGSAGAARIFPVVERETPPAPSPAARWTVRTLPVVERDTPLASLLAAGVPVLTLPVVATPLTALPAACCVGRAASEEGREALPGFSCASFRAGRTVPGVEREPALSGTAAPVELAPACPGLASTCSGLASACSGLASVCSGLSAGAAGRRWIWGRGSPGRGGNRPLPLARGPEAATGLAEPSTAMSVGRWPPGATAAAAAGCGKGRGEFPTRPGG